MSLPTIIQNIYGEFVFTGLYSFEFVNKNRDTITEIFFMIPPKNKSVSEPTRSSTIATLGGNYNVDGGNATKNITISGDLYFPYVGSPDNPVARNNVDLNNQISGYEEFLKLRWMLIRYRDYTLHKNAKIEIPTSLLGIKEISKLYKNISRKINNKVGALYDQVRVIFHDYDMDDHFFVRVINFTGSQSSDKYIVGNYTITLDAYQVDKGQSTALPVTKKTTIEEVDNITTSILR